MSKRTRIAAAVLISLAVIIAIFTSVQGASLSAHQDTAGAHLVSGLQVNLDHYREAAPSPAYLEPEFPANRRNGCDHESQTSPED